MSLKTDNVFGGFRRVLLPKALYNNNDFVIYRYNTIYYNTQNEYLLYTSSNNYVMVVGIFVFRGWPVRIRVRPLPSCFHRSHKCGRKGDRATPLRAARDRNTGCSIQSDRVGSGTDHIRCLSRSRSGLGLGPGRRRRSLDGAAGTANGKPGAAVDGETARRGGFRVQGRLCRRTQRARP